MPAPEATGLGRSAPRAPIQKRHINPIYYMETPNACTAVRALNRPGGARQVPKIQRKEMGTIMQLQIETARCRRWPTCARRVGMSPGPGPDPGPLGAAFPTSDP